ncbi:MAG TPA: large-conductance mechanosensitive channel protein MscL [Patescibacteria group bacterium]|nr:large-conductance mechanosensitive channel protein MscL [Patescibacteria group bacterium]
MNKYWQEFHKFAVKGNVVDLAVAVIIGGAFGKIITSLVADIIMPVVGVVLGGINFKTWSIILKKASFAESGTLIHAGVAINIGNFIQNIFDFFVIALSVFLMVKIIVRSKEKFFKKEKKQEDEGKPAKVLSGEEKLLTEIRDILKKESK